MTVRADDGPSVTKGWELPLGSATAVTGVTGASAGYESGIQENPDAGPNCFFAGNMLKDPRYRYRGGGGQLVVGGYPNQAVGYVDNQILTIDMVPSTISAVNIAAATPLTINVPQVLVSVSGAGITVEPTAVTVLATGNVVPAGSLRIDAAPTWNAFGASGAMEGWTGGACGRAVSLTSGSNLSGANITIRGYDVYGAPLTQTMAGPNGNTVNTLKGFKWIASVTPNASNAGTMSVGTADVFELPIMARRFSQLLIWWDETLITANTGFVRAVTTDPSTALLGDTRGTYATQTASDGSKRLVVTQRILPADLVTTLATGMFGVAQV